VPPHSDIEALRKGLQARQAQIAEWATLTLRQHWADESFMRDHLRTAGVRIGSNLEPATVRRLRSVLRAAGLQGVETHDALGCSLNQFLKLNPELPLWAAVALVLESCGRGSDHFLSSQGECFDMANDPVKANTQTKPNLAIPTAGDADAALRKGKTPPNPDHADTSAELLNDCMTYGVRAST
jgi:hypothetical protein